MAARDDRKIKKHLADATTPQKLSGMEKKILHKLTKGLADLVEQVVELKQRMSDLEGVQESLEVANSSET